MARAAALDIVTRDYVTVAKLRGESAWSVIRRELLPNTTGVLLVSITPSGRICAGPHRVIGISWVWGAPPDSRMGPHHDENRSLITFAPITVLGPGLMLATLVIGLNLFTEGLARILGRTVRLANR